VVGFLLSNLAIGGAGNGETDPLQNRLTAFGFRGSYDARQTEHRNGTVNCSPRSAAPNRRRSLLFSSWSDTPT
jgi:hypothetical protein